MKHDAQAVRQYILAQTEFEAPTIQKEFELTYTQTKKLLDELLHEGAIVYDGGVKYKVVNGHAPSSRVYTPKSDTEALRLKALYECLKCGKISTGTIQCKCIVGYETAAETVKWMERNGFATPPPDARLCITMQEFTARYGNPDEDYDIRRDISMIEDERDRYIVQRALYLENWLAENRKKKPE